MQMIQLLISISLIILMFYNLFYRTKKAIEYKNDERWKTIELQASKFSNNYYQFLIIFIAIWMTLLLFIESWNFTLSIDQALRWLFYLILIGQLVEMFLLKYLNQKM